MNINIKSILTIGERVTLECKKAQHSVPNSLWDTYPAFANTYGGTILLGVVEHTEEKDNAWNEKHWIRRCVYLLMADEHIARMNYSSQKLLHVVAF